MNKKVGMSKSSNALKFMSLTAALAFTLVAFEWKSYDNDKFVYTNPDSIEVPIEPILITYPKKKEVKIKITNKKIIEEKKNATETIKDNILVEKKIIPFKINLDSITPVDPDEEFVFEALIEKPVEFPHQKAEFPGGDQALINFLSDEIKYPEIASSVGIEGEVNLQFVVRKDGSIVDVKIMRGIGGGCEEEAVRALLTSPIWKPGKVDGAEVDSYFNLPVKFGFK